ncbi:LPS export ABC transporter periplasmic protein LptC [Thermosynechococcus sp. HN-54]|uniref:LPS export ABC transporter periplasmic protein LptC n=1 Tax=Thermosynechococcus sp. HN-54 TaxID=2933959 RepID=UPI00202CB2E6|nr:LPS export ABC transporter periplasmic protein LptC [Thermosynechococcus sp. HN-54]URR35607.1 LPS export ABC transporter periplasmic protein LptC [Thermosynechococcus sp. HN-54]
MRLLRSTLPLCLLLALAGCGWVDQWVGEEPSPEPEITGEVQLQNLTLRQTNEKGQLLWLLQAAGARYQDDDRQQLEIQNLTGELKAEGKPAYKVAAKVVKVRQRQGQLWIEGRTTLTDLQHKGRIVADQLVWQGDRGVLIAQKNLQARYPQVTVTAKRLEADSQRQELRALNAVQVTSAAKEVKDLRLNTESLVWQQQPNRLLAGVVGEGGVTVVGVAGDRQGQRLQAQRAIWSISDQVVTLEGGVQVQLPDPALRVDGEMVRWLIPQQQLVSDRPLRVAYPTQGIQGQANRGVFLIAENRAIFDNAQINSQPQQAQLRAQRLNWWIPQQRVEASGQVEIQRPNAHLRTAQLIWRIPQQEVEAQGGVFYRQSHPRLQVQGQRAKGWLDRQEVIVSGNVQSEVPVQLRLP